MPVKRFFLLGERTLESNVATSPAGAAAAYSFTAANSGTVSVVTVYVDSHDQAHTLIAGVYSNRNDRPDVLLTSGSLISPRAGAWDTVTVPAGAVTSGTSYWIALMSTNGTMTYRASSIASCSSDSSAGSHLSRLPSSWTSGPRANGCPLSAYAAGTPGAGDPPWQPAAPTATPTATTAATQPTTTSPLTLPAVTLPPVNSEAPSVSGNPVQGQVVSTTTGSWLDAPTAYSYQWEDCDTSGNNCTAISGATSSSYTLAALDVGDTIRSVVSASNGAGSSLLPGTSAPTAVVTSPPLPTAEFTFSPTAPSTAQAVTFDGSGSTCSATPCSYDWTTSSSSFGSGQSAVYTFSTAGTHQVTLTVTDALDRSATATSSIVVAQVAPTNTALPTITGTAQQGDTLSATKGSWTGSPTSYSYQWNDCNSSGASCSNIAGATASTYALASSDVGDTLRVVVTATNGGGSTPATSGATNQIIASGGGGGGGGGSCTTTLTSTTSINSDLTPGAVVCLAAGTYGSLTITASPSANATLTAAPGAHVVLGGVDVDGSNLTVSQLHVQDGLNINDGASDDTLDHNEVQNLSCGYGIGVFGVQTSGGFTSVATNDVISNNVIHNTGTTCEADAIRIQGYKNLTVTGNEEYDIQDPNGNHTDVLQSYQADVATSGLTITDNYIHDTCVTQGFPFLKDGDIANVVIEDNLMVRDDVGSCGSNNDVGTEIIENSDPITIRNNTNLMGASLSNGGSASDPTAYVDHNVLDSLNSLGPCGSPSCQAGYNLTESYNVLTGGKSNTWSITPNSTDVFNANPGFECASSCGNGTPAGDDYELSSNPNDIGINWSPANEQYGPSS